MAIDVLNTGTAAGSGDGESLRSAMTKVNSNFAVAENSASKIVQASSADTTADKVMLTDHAWRGAQLGDYFTYGGTADAITLTSANLRAGGTLIKGMKFRFEATATNTGATTIAVDGGSAIACVTPTGAALPAGFIRTDVFTECEYDGANFVVSRKIESGSNANGRWNRWENGLLTTETSYDFPSFDATVLAGVVYRSGTFLIDTPETFIDVDFSVSTDFETSSGANTDIFSTRITSKTTSGVNVRFFSGSSISGITGVILHMTCAGKWY